MAEYRLSFAGSSIKIPRYDTPVGIQPGDNWVIYNPVYLWNVDYKVEVVYDSMRMLWALQVKVGGYHVQYKFTDELLSEIDVPQLSADVIDRVAAVVEMPPEAQEYLTLLTERAFGLDTGE